MEDIQTQYSNKQATPDLQFERPLNWRKYLFLFLTNWYWFLITIFATLSIAYLKNRYTIPIYQASATLLIEDEVRSDDILTEIRSVRRRRNRSDMANEIANLRTFSLHRRTIDSLGWNIFWTAHGRVAIERPIYNAPPYLIEIDTVSSPWYLNQTFFVQNINEESLRFYNNNGIDTVFKFGDWNDLAGWKFRIEKCYNRGGYASYSFIIYNLNTLAKQYLSKVNYSSSEEQGTVIIITSQGPVVQREIDYLNALCENYIQSGLERKQLISENTLEFINSQIKTILDSLQKTETQLLSFRINESVVDLSTEGKQAYDKLQKFYDQKTQLKLKRNYYTYLKEYIESKRDPQAIIAPILVDANDLLLINQVENLQSLYEEREMLTFSAESENPSLVRLNSRIQTSRNKIMEIIDGLIKNNDLAWKQIDTEEEQIRKQLLQLPLSEQELLNIQRKYEVNSQFYTFLLQKRAEAGIQKASTISNVRILDRANPAMYSVTEGKQPYIYLIALVLGLVVPASIIFIADYFDNRIKDKNDIEDNTPLPILGVVSHDISGEIVPVHTIPGSAFAESFRQIRTNLKYILREPERKVIMISSTISGEGKTFIAVNLSTILAMSNKKVLLCGFDLRRPSIHRLFNLSNVEGISTFLSGKSKYSDIVFSTNIKGLDIMNAGPIPPNPAELIETDKMDELLNTIVKSYDYIVIDTPPIALVTDALLISKHTHTNIFVIRQNYSPKGTLEIINSLQDKQMKSISILVNDIRESKAFGYRYYYGYGYSYGYHYKYNYNYYMDDSKKNSS